MKSDSNYLNPLFKNSENVKFVKDALFGVMNEPMGTAYRSRLNSEKYQYAGKTGVKINFFGKSTSAPKGTALFQMKTGLPILVGFCKLLPDFKYSISFQYLEINEDTHNIEEASRLINQVFSRILENAIKLNPEQYFWFHRKWR